jgi:hypothetical protein
MLHVVDFRTAAGDTGEPDAPSIQPYTNGESADQTVFRRPTENARTRTEILRDLVREHILLKDYNDGGVALAGGGTLTISVGGSGLTFTTGSNLYVLPFATPGGGASAPYVVSTKAAVSAGAGVNELVFTSVQKQFEGDGIGGAEFPECDANKISVEILDGGVSASLTVVVEGAAAELNNVKITVDASLHTLNDVIAAVAGVPAAAALVVASLGGSAVGTNLCPLFGPAEWGADLGARFLRGGVAHEITPGGLVNFFTNPLNELDDGETLAIAYDKIFNTSTTGGRVQSTPENTNINVDLALFNTRRNPELIPNCIPICKKAESGSELVFVNGAIIRNGSPATLKFDSYALISAETGTLGAPLTWDRMATGTDHNPPTTIRQALDNADGHIHNTLNEVEASRSSVLHGAKSDLDTRLEASEDHINRTVITVSDNATSTGGLYNTGADSLQNALTANGGGHVYLVRPGTYNITSAHTLTKRTLILAQDEGTDQVTLNFTHGAGYGFTFTGGEGSRVEGFTFTGTNPDYISFSAGASEGTVKGCVSSGRFLIDADRCHILHCRITSHSANPSIEIDDCLGTLIGECAFQIGNGPAGISYNPTTGNKWNCKIRNCYGAVSNGAFKLLYAGTNAYNLSVENLTIVCNPFTDTSSPVVHLNGAMHTIRNVSYTLGGAGIIKQPMFYMEGGGVVEVIDLDLDNQTVQHTAKSRNPFTVKSLTDKVVIVRCLTVRDFEFPNDDTVFRETPVIVGQPVSATSAVIFDGVSVSGMGDSGVPAAFRAGVVIGSNATSSYNPDGAGSLTLRDITIDTTGLSYQGILDEYVMITNLPPNSTVSDCLIFGSGTHWGIVARGEVGYVIQNNRIYVFSANAGIPIQVRANGATDNPDSALVDGNIISHGDIRLNFHAIHVLGWGPEVIDRPKVTNNEVVYGGGGWSGASIRFDDCDKGTVFHNNVSNGIGYGTVTNMLPAVGVLSTYNIVA